MTQKQPGCFWPGSDCIDTTAVAKHGSEIQLGGTQWLKMQTLTAHMPKEKSDSSQGPISAGVRNRHVNPPGGKMNFEYFTYKGIKFPTPTYNEETIKFAENDFQVLDDDIFNVTYPKSGTNWMIEILTLIKHDGDPTLCKSVPNFERSPWCENIIGPSKLKDLPSPRLLSSHLPIHIFPKSFFTSNAKIVYTMRNPKDVLVSLFHFAKMVCFFKDTENFQETLEGFLQGNVTFGTWFDHIRGWMQMKDDSRFFYITYEELQQDLWGSVVRISKFLGKELDDEAINSVIEHSSFKNMKDNEMCNFKLLPPNIIDNTKGSLMRKGISGDWKNHFTVAQSEYFDKVYQEKMKDLNLKFFWEES